VKCAPARPIRANARNRPGTQYDTSGHIGECHRDRFEVGLFRFFFAFLFFHPLLNHTPPLFLLNQECPPSSSFVFMQPSLSEEGPYSIRFVFFPLRRRTLRRLTSHRMWPPTGPGAHNYTDVLSFLSPPNAMVVGGSTSTPLPIQIKTLCVANSNPPALLVPACCLA